MYFQKVPIFTPQNHDQNFKPQKTGVGGVGWGRKAAPRRFFLSSYLKIGLPTCVVRSTTSFALKKTKTTKRNTRKWSIENAKLPQLIKCCFWFKAVVWIFKKFPQLPRKTMAWVLNQKNWGGWGGVGSKGRAAPIFFEQLPENWPPNMRCAFYYKLRFEKHENDKTKTTKMKYRKCEITSTQKVLFLI